MKGWVWRSKHGSFIECSLVPRPHNSGRKHFSDFASPGNESDSVCWALTPCGVIDSYSGLVRSSLRQLSSSPFTAGVIIGLEEVSYSVQEGVGSVSICASLIGEEMDATVTVETQDVLSLGKYSIKMH